MFGTKRVALWALAALSVAIAWATPAAAVVYTWSASGVAAWDSSSTNWTGGVGTLWDASTGTGNVADFNSSATTAGISGVVVANGLTFDAPATVSGGTLTLGGTTPTIAVNGASGTIASLLAGNVQWTKSGAGTLVLSNTANNFSGGVNLNGGVLNFAAGVLGTSAVTFSGGTLQWASGNTQDISAKVSIAGSGQIAYLDTTGVTTFNTAITGNGGLVKLGSGKISMSVASSYLGGTTVSGGSLGLGSGGGTGTLRSNLTINPGAYVNLGTANALGYTAGLCVPNVYVIGGQINSGGGAGTDNGFLTNVYLSGGSMVNSGGGQFTFSQPSGCGITSNASSATSYIGAPISLRGVGALNITVAAGTTPSGVDLLIAGVISNGSGSQGGLVKLGGGLLALTGVNTFTNGATISAGTLQLGNGGTTGALSAGTATSNVIVDNATLAFNRSNTVTQGADFTAAAISGSGAVVQLGNGTLALTATNNSYSGGTTVSAGALSITTTGALPGWNAANRYSVAPGAMLIVTNGVSDASVGAMIATGNFQAGATLGFDTSSAGRTVASNIADSGGALGITKLGANQLNLTGNNSFSGPIAVSAGTLQTGSATALGSNPTVSISGGVLDLNGQVSTLNQLAGTGGTLLDNASTAAILTVNQSANTTFAGVLNDGAMGALSLIKTGTGSLNLTTPSIFSGGTTVSGGTLQLSVSNAQYGTLKSPTVVVNAGGVLALASQDALGYTTGREVLAINGGIVSNVTANGRITLQNNFTMTSGTLAGVGTGDALGGVYSLDGVGPVATSDAAGNPALISATAISLETAAVPFNVTRGPASPAADLIVSSNITPYNGNGGSLVLSGNGVMLLTGTNSYWGGTTINGGTLAVGGAGSLGSGSYGGAILDNATLLFGTSASQTLNSAISGSGSLVQAGPGTLTLAGGNSYTGGTSVTGGTLAITGGTQAAGGALTIGAGGLLTTNVSNALGSAPAGA
jgi:fibronectin-binding autotransporter adhesin